MSSRLLSSPQRRPLVGNQKRDRSGLSPIRLANTKRFKTTGEDDASVYQLRSLPPKNTDTNCEVHETIRLCPVTKALVDTEVFQRLRHIKQLGACQYLYVSADHNRFQHSLGVYHLAKEMVTHLREQQPRFGVTDKDMLCVSLAGLLHDVGHGPFSHIYETFRFRVLPDFLKQFPELKENYKKFDEVPEGWSHEMSSLQMIDTALAELGLEIDLENLDEPLKQIGDGVEARSMRVFSPSDAKDEIPAEAILTSRDWIFIKECILGKPLPEVVEKLGLREFIGRTVKTKEWLHDIVNNRHSGLDVDKMDYFARDRKRAFGENTKDFKMIYDARVAPGTCPNPNKCFKCNGRQGQKHFMICYPEKRAEAVWIFFNKRFQNHGLVYQHKKTSAAEALICDILALADSCFTLKSHDGEEFPISRAVLKSDFLLRLDDNILSLIEHSSATEYPQKEMEDARHWVRCLKTHQHYKCAIDYKLNLKKDTDKNIYEMVCEDPQMVAEAMVHEFESIKEQRQPGDGPTLEVKDFVIKPYSIDYGRKDQNPLLCVRFFDAMNEKLTGPIDEIPEAIELDEDEYDYIIPRRFRNVGLRIFARRPDKECRELINQFFLHWVEKMGVAGQTPMPRYGGIEEMDDDDDDEDDYDDNYDNNSAPRMLSQDD